MGTVMKKKVMERKLLVGSMEELYAFGRGHKTSGEDMGRGSESHILEGVLDYYGMAAVHVPRDYGDKEAFDYIIWKSGLMMRRITLSGKWWREAAVPVLVMGKDGREMALLPDRWGRYFWEAAGKRHVVTKEQAAQITGEAYSFHRPLKRGEVGMKAFWRFLFQSVTASDILVIGGISLLLELCGLILPYINNIVYNTIIPSGTSREIPGIIVLVVSTVIFSSFIGLARSVWVTRVGNKMEIAGQAAVWKRLFELPASFFREYDSGEIFNRANAINQVCEILGGGMIPAALTAMLSIVYLFQISWFAQELVLLSCVIIVLILANIFLSCYLQIRHRQRENTVDNQAKSVLYQLVNGIAKIRTAGAEVRAFHVWSETWKQMPVMKHFFLQITSALGNVISLGGSIVLYVAAWQCEMTASAFVAFQTAFSAFLLSVLALADFGIQLGSLKPALDALRPILEETPEAYGDGEYMEQLTGKIEVANVDFRYHADMPYVLHGFNLEIRPGEYIGIVGGSGCGKSTLMRLLLGFEVPETGSLYYDGKDLAGLDLRSVRRRIGVVLQNGKLFSGDIFSNLAICAPWLTMEQAWEAAEQAGLAEDIRQMPMGMFTMLSEDGGGISGGQKQRMLIARAIAAKPDILLFDEATSALDNMTQATVVKTLRSLSCTRLVIAHRLSTIKDCDRIIYLEKGKIAEQGTYMELMAQNGKFAQMAARQLA